MWIRPIGFLTGISQKGILWEKVFLYPFSLLIGSVICQIERRIPEELRAMDIHHYFNS
jgi:hypothetical protein